MVLLRSHTLPNGDRVRVRLAHSSDRESLARLLADGDMAVRRAIRGWTVVATVWNGAHEQIVGFATLDGPASAADPDVRALLQRALDEHSSTWTRRVA